MTSFACRRHTPVTTGALVLAFWLVAALLVVVSQLEFEPVVAAIATIGVLLIVSFAYTRVCAQQAGITHALGVGIAWLALSIVAEMALTSRAPHGWFYLLGSPARPLLRNIDLFVWIFAPALFAREELT